VINISHIAVPYSKALFDLAREKKLLEEVYKDMELVGGVCRSSREFTLLLKSPVVQVSRKINILTGIFGKKINPMTMSFLSIIIKKKREKIIPDICLAFIELYKDHKGILPTNVLTAVPLSDKIRKQVVEVMKKYTGKEIELTSGIREDLIGGFILQWGDNQYDASILKQLKGLKRRTSGTEL
jgi:F-type H+-transporting ATPase subunit delta